MSYFLSDFDETRNLSISRRYECHVVSEILIWGAGGSGGHPPAHFGGFSGCRCTEGLKFFFEVAGGSGGVPPFTLTQF